MYGTLMNNYVSIEGEVSSELVLSHSTYGECFYLFDLKVTRLSGVCDIIPVTISESLIDTTQDHVGKHIKVIGQYRSFNKHDGSRNRLLLSVFAREIEFTTSETSDGMNSNKIILDGYICKVPNYRRTPLGREVTDLLIAVNRPYGKSDYIPCIVWGRTAKRAAELNVGERCVVHGRIQSREYSKKMETGEAEKRVAYEVSVSRLNPTPTAQEEVVEEQE